ncbi:hypothetical protein B566_EDAN004917 [Ephemera danica]|nr:hypothetical protein B566_EDAN004917 [Ephemera danica]
MERLISLDNPVFSGFAIHAAVLVLKCMLMAPLTLRHRMATGTFANPEDVKHAQIIMPKAKVSFDDLNVERVRRAHLNDLENIPVFLVVALLYVLTGPNTFIALNLFRVFTLARLVHTIFYAVVPQSKARGMAFIVGLLVTFYMSVQVILYYS